MKIENKDAIYNQFKKNNKNKTPKIHMIFKHFAYELKKMHITANKNLQN